MDSSWILSANDPDGDFPISNLPFCVVQNTESDPQIGVVIGDQVLNLARLSESITLPCADDLKHSSLNSLMGQGEQKNLVLRAELIRLLEDRPSRLRDQPELYSRVLRPLKECQLGMPVQVGDFTDFYSSLYHATNVGAMFRPDQPLLPNYKHLPIGYHGRASSVVASQSPIRRPCGQTAPKPPNESPSFGPSERLDYELELGILMGQGNEWGQSIGLNEAWSHVFGFCLLNDWSARDIQKWEYQPLGPFLAKSFATSISPLVVPSAALKPFRTQRFERDAEDPALLSYLEDPQDASAGGLDIQMEVHLTSEKMRQADMDPFKVSHGNYADMYWTVGQLVTHHASNGCNLRPGDLLGSGTVSGRERISRGCLLERNWRGDFENPVSGSQRTPLELPTGEKRDFLEDSDEVTLTAYCEKDGAARIGFGSCVGRIVGSSSS